MQKNKYRFVSAPIPDRQPLCICGKVCFDKRTAQTKKNSLEEMGNRGKFRIYQCPSSGDRWWHLTSSNVFGRYDE